MKVVSVTIFYEIITSILYNAHCYGPHNTGWCTINSILITITVLCSS